MAFIIGLVLIAVIFSALAFILRRIWVIVGLGLIVGIGWYVHERATTKEGDVKQIAVRSFVAERLHLTDTQTPTWKARTVIKNNSDRAVKALNLRILLQECNEDIFSTKILESNKSCETVGSEILNVSIVVPPTEIREFSEQVSFHNLPSALRGAQQVSYEIVSVVLER